MYRRSVLIGFIGVLAAAGLVLGACGDDGIVVERIPSEPTQVATDSGGVSNSSIVPNTFLTFSGDRYRLEGLAQANLGPPKSEYREAGTATHADIDQTDLTVYRREGDTALYTYADAHGEGEESTPAFWYRWVPEQ